MICTKSGNKIKSIDKDLGSGWYSVTLATDNKSAQYALWMTNEEGIQGHPEVRDAIAKVAPREKVKPPVKCTVEDCQCAYHKEAMEGWDD